MAELTKQQRKILLEWAAEGLRLPEINKRAAEIDPPFEVEYLQLKNARKRAGKKFTELRDQIEADAISEGLARKAVRIRHIEALYDKHMALIEARGAEMAETKEIAGGETGLLVRDYKGKDADTPVYKYDAALIKEARGLLDDIARELGDRRTKIDMTSRIDVTKLSDEELDALIGPEGESGA